SAPASCRLASRADDHGPNAVSYAVRFFLPPAGPAVPENKSDLFSTRKWSPEGKNGFGTPSGDKRSRQDVGA
ncbi:MAG: hypothetical protein ACYTG1_03315, partial [Planctomycetota bacterium]